MSRSGARLWPLLAGLIPLVPILAGFFLTAGSGGVSTAQASIAPRYLPAGGAGATAGPGHPAPDGLQVPGGPGALTAAVIAPVEMRTAPAGRPLAHLARTDTYGSPQVFLVVRRRGKWLGVLSPQAGNGRLGWIPAASTRLLRNPYEIQVSLSARQLTVRHLGRVVQSEAIAVGAPASPTPTGHFAVTDLLDTGTPGGPYGCCILALSAQAPHAIQGWSGGSRIAIHSTPETSSIGYALSHGCMRLTLEQGRWLLHHIPLGTPVTVRE